jgi:hypothetical protein
MKGDEVPIFDKIGKLADWVGRYFDENFGGKVTNPTLGEVVIDKRAAKDSLSHGLGKTKAQAFYLVPNVIKNGRIIHEGLGEKDLRMNAFLIAAPVEIDGKAHVEVAMVRKDPNTQRFYLHEVVAIDKLQGASQTGAVPEGTELAGKAKPGAIRNILRQIFTVKDSDAEPRFSYAGKNAKSFEDAEREGLAEPETKPKENEKPGTADLSATESLRDLQERIPTMTDAERAETAKQLDEHMDRMAEEGREIEDMCLNGGGRFSIR